MFLRGPAKSPKNDLSNVAGIKQLMATPRVQRQQKDDLTDVQVGTIFLPSVYMSEFELQSLPNYFMFNFSVVYFVFKLVIHDLNI